MFKKAMAATAAVCVCAAICGAQAPEKKAHHAFSIQDNSISYEYGSWFHDPFTDKNNNIPANPDSAAQISKHIIEFNHVDIGNKLGDNVFNVQYLMSNKANPSSQTGLHDNTQDGAKDAYFVYRHDFWLGRLLNKNLSYGPIQDIGIEIGADYGSKNDDWGNQRRSPMAGVSVNFKAPNHGFVKLAAMWTREFNEEGTDISSYLYTSDYQTYYSNPYTTACEEVEGVAASEPYGCTPVLQHWGKPITYAQEATFQANWGIPFNILNAPIMFQGFGTLNSSKGYGAASLVPYTGVNGIAAEYTYAGTKPELLLRPILLYNFGSLFGHGHVWQIGVGYEYWNNMYGVDHHASKSIIEGYDGATPLLLYPSSLENAPFFQLTFHL